jgi:hypothetical protein
MEKNLQHGIQKHKRIFPKKANKKAKVFQKKKGELIQDHFVINQLQSEDPHKFTMDC